MKWITHEYPKADQVACSWLIKHFLDKNAEFLFAPASQVLSEAERLTATPFAIPDVDYGAHGQESAFEAIVKYHNLTEDPALVLFGKIINNANGTSSQPEGAGLQAIAEGFQHLDFKDDDTLIRAEWIVCNALYGYCIHSIVQSKPNGLFA